jgi:hypothetical protein
MVYRVMSDGLPMMSNGLRMRDADRALCDTRFPSPIPVVQIGFNILVAPARYREHNHIGGFETHFLNAATAWALSMAGMMPSKRVSR